MQTFASVSVFLGALAKIDKVIIITITTPPLVHCLMIADYQLSYSQKEAPFSALSVSTFSPDSPLFLFLFLLESYSLSSHFLLSNLMDWI